MSIQKMSDKPEALFNTSNSWFHKYATVEDAPDGIFKGFSDRFNGITVDSNLETCLPQNFPAILKKSILHWIDNKKRAIWFKVHLNATHWVPELANNEFKFHHAKENFVMMYRWLPEETLNLPPFAHTMVGVGALVFNDKNQILVVSEKHALIEGSWKLPGGYVEPSEDFVAAAIREVFEETNIKTSFKSIVSLRHAHKAAFGCSDLYIVIALLPVSSEIKKCDREISMCEWMDVEDYLAHPKVHETNRNFVRTYLKYISEGINITCKEEFHQILKKQYNIYSVELEQDGSS
ncbi:uncharacterized protein LOC129778892 isoform X2 [Toxorhynchites rutilus septentrionalis]|uniref:uncharacterized protein LOC129778892 isoform X2 n=1 Tax=Toxorhynchites rutilus septentrionalis TaxID=329112 RepID=UPI00247A9BEA|nr:uncharacterized protein LOC129778892 isoform X2 [Toxorhynchites rutilus septentrionalis]